MTTLRIIVFLLGLGSVAAQFILALVEDSRKEKQNAELRDSLRDIKHNVQTLALEGKLGKEDARRILNVTISEGVQLHEDFSFEVKRGSEGK